VVVCDWSGCGRAATKRIGYSEEPTVVVCCDEHAKIRIPDGFALSELPDDFVRDNGSG
jgi:hypothetical protein